MLYGQAVFRKQLLLGKNASLKLHLDIKFLLKTEQISLCIRAGRYLNVDKNYMKNRQIRKFIQCGNNIKTKWQRHV